MNKTIKTLALLTATIGLATVVKRVNELQNTKLKLKDMRILCSSKEEGINRMLNFINQTGNELIAYHFEDDLITVLFLDKVNE